MGLNQRKQGVWANNLVHNLHILTGQLMKDGADSLSLTGQPNACGGVREGGGLCHILPGHRPVEAEPMRRQVEEAWGIPAGRIPAEPGLHTMVAFLGRKRTLRVHFQAVDCTACSRCSKVCPMGLTPSVGEGLSSYCWNCGECVDVCEHDALTFRWRWRGNDRLMNGHEVTLLPSDNSVR